MVDELLDNLPVKDLLRLSTMSLATADAAGRPYAAPVYFVVGEGLRFYFFSEASSRHSQDVYRSSLAAAAIYPETSGWQDIRGLQMTGIIEEVIIGEEWERAWELYQAKFPFVAELRALVTRNSLYVFKPNWIRLLDNSLGFGQKQEWSLG